MSSHTKGALALAFLLAGCFSPGCQSGPSAPDAGPLQEPVRTEPARARSSFRQRMTCRLGAQMVLASGIRQVRTVGLARSDTVTMVVFARGDGTLLAAAARPLPGAEPVAIPLTGELFALEPLEPDRFVALSRGSCPAGIERAHCIFALALGPDGRAIGESIPIALPGPVRTLRVQTSGGFLYVARAHELGPPSLDRVIVEDGEITVRTVELGEDLDLSAEPAEVYALAVAGGGWAVLWRHGSAEDARGGIVLSTQLDEHEVAALHDAVLVESFQWFGGALSVIAAFEFSRPVHVRIGADGEVRGEPRPLSPGVPLPLPFGDRRTAAIVGTGTDAAIEIRDGAGDGLSRVPLGDASYVAADVARRDAELLVAVARRSAEGTRISVAPIECEDTSPMDSPTPR